ncbi:MAG: hypothetical protein NT136_04165 [Candidatus Moranbacteria bacterium]|nr:hypothetical protein [Candidatus Moranbacteria bacterium]
MLYYSRILHCVQDDSKKYYKKRGGRKMPLPGYEAIVRRDLKDQGVMIPDDVSLMKVSGYCGKKCVGVCFGKNSLYERRIIIHGIFCEEMVPYDLIKSLLEKEGL